eukprot:442383-Pelagomonas_calceolata.AAC.1
MELIMARTAALAELNLNISMILSRHSALPLHGSEQGLELQGVGLQPENLADRLLVQHYHPASKIDQF